MESNIKDKIKFTKWFSLIIFVVFIVPLYYAIFKHDVIDKENIRYSLFVIAFFCSLLELIAIMLVDIKLSVRLSQNKNNVIEAQKLRKKAIALNNAFGVAFLITLVTSFVAPTMNLAIIIVFGIFLLVFFIMGTVCLGMFYQKPIEISFEQIHDNDYILYLRAFSEDQKSFKERATPGYWGGFHDFIEEEFLKYFPNTIAVGQPNELLPSRGAKRLYFGEDEWQGSVQKMIEECKYILILISSNPNCIWELKKLKEVKEKVVFIVNNKKEYSCMTKSLQDFWNFPSYDDVCTPFCFYLERESNQLKVIEFHNEILSYISVSEQIKSAMR